MNKLMRILALSLLAFSINNIAMADDGSNYTWNKVEGFGNAALQSITPGGNSFAGGAHYTPSYKFSDSIKLKGLFGGELFKSTTLTNSKVYFVANYFLAANLNILSQSPITFNAGAGGGTDLRSSGKTRVGFLLGGDYDFGSKKLFGIFDHALLDGYYYLNSSKLFVINYGLGVSL